MIGPEAEASASDPVNVCVVLPGVGHDEMLVLVLTDPLVVA
jgi:hypothetical protein